ncbi:hypothetical protein CAOG_08558 [Capsaspora owczarzaki ATCC 30864]|nr:hypothetical protein CAOG_08558 [Capsaspora owczarzaki ATCC 30864]|eukprot:XP_011270140.1 hypothetical protein CAOG_08558 [Capsaspora owczarzaki ATCC 30864]
MSLTGGRGRGRGRGRGDYSNVAMDAGGNAGQAAAAGAGPGMPGGRFTRSYGHDPSQAGGNGARNMNDNWRGGGQAGRGGYQRGGAGAGGDQGGGGGGSWRGGRGGYQQQSRAPSDGGANAHANAGGGGGVRVVVSGVGNASEAPLMNFFRNNAAEQFVYDRFRPRGGNVEFFVPTFAVARGLRRVAATMRFNGRQIFVIFGDDADNAMTDGTGSAAGFRGGARHGASAAGNEHGQGMGEAEQQQLLQLMSQRFNPSQLFLDLSALSSAGFQSANYVPLVNSIVQLVAGNCPQITALSLSDNNIRATAAYGALTEAAPNVQVVSLVNNNIQDIGDLEAFVGWSQLRSLGLAGNPFSQFVDDQMAYEAQLLTLFPNLVELDGVPLSVSPGSVYASSLPLNQGSYFESSNLREFVMPFLQAFVDLFNAPDRSQRQLLTCAYSADALLSYSAASGLVQGVAPQAQRGNRPHPDAVFQGAQPAVGPPVHAYREHSRNLSFVHEPNRRQALLNVGRANIVAFLSQLPFDFLPETLVVDSWSISPAVIIIQLSGELLDGAHNNDHRVFSRTMTVTATDPASDSAADGWAGCIMNDQWQLTNYLTRSGNMASLPASIGDTSFIADAPAHDQVQSAAAQDASALAFAQQLSQASGLNMTASTQLITQCNGDYNSALSLFLQLQAANQIPAEAFVA